ncbi:YifB family Mg chelatase-like AAA ATPase [Zhihengliuella halotolerans]|uniref:Magnesium chelatase family protein n=1 Tax=Zhihengliuella halotolerans TaxID=370736 RepID=A0A4Q8AD09_9MICC|nr:YifB family Mg chelatase-like AAA ATPase [Zhihengliuella halotolerans]RZU61525.1 magnesium chelatase family protein [Zhihengliuella halotolerans]
MTGGNLGRATGVVLTGLTGHVVDVEADIGGGLPAFVLLGLPDASLGEARDRIRSAARNTGVPLSPRRITVNLQPASLPKRGSALDLAIVTAALSADDSMHAQPDTVYIGELGLDGALRPVPGVLPSVLSGVRHGYRRFVVPEANLEEARLVSGAHVTGHRHLADVVANSGATRDIVQNLRWNGASPRDSGQVHKGTGDDTARDAAADYSDVRGQEAARFALEVAAAGRHHLMLRGEPGAGKTMLAERLPTILPPLNDEEALEVTAVHSVHGSQPVSRLIRRPPLVSPHHTATMAALVGGGSGFPRPGAASRAHRGVLFLDEAPEFRGGVLDALRQPLESGEMTVHRASGAATFPARFQLVLAANLCPCGRTAAGGRDCECTPTARRRYLGRLSGPLLDRVDIQVAVPRVSPTYLASAPAPESSRAIAARVRQARQRQAERLREHGLRTNGEVPSRLLRGGLAPAPAALTKLDEAFRRGWLSARGYDRVIRLGWTIADLAGREAPALEDLDVALQLRQSQEVRP